MNTTVISNEARHTDRRHEALAPTAPVTFTHSTETLEKPTLVVDAHYRIRSANRAFCEQFGIAASVTNGTLLFSLNNGQWNHSSVHQMLDDVAAAAVGTAECVLQIELDGFGYYELHLAANRRRTSSSQELTVITVDACIPMYLSLPHGSEGAPLHPALPQESPAMSVTATCLFQDLARIVGLAQEIRDTSHDRSSVLARDIIETANRVQAACALHLMPHCAAEPARPTLRLTEDWVLSEGNEDGLYPLPFATAEKDRLILVGENDFATCNSGANRAS
ncbi:MAG: hypothetical protein OHK0029_13830 [Armatimonadaceae bacterium]